MVDKNLDVSLFIIMAAMGGGNAAQPPTVAQVSHAINYCATPNVCWLREPPPAARACLKEGQGSVKHHSGTLPQRCICVGTQRVVGV